jgi:SAM-dependent methyltransferase
MEGRDVSVPPEGWERADPCGACGSAAYREVARVSERAIVRCGGCSVVRLHERVAPGRIGELYRGYHAGPEPTAAVLSRQLENPTFGHRRRRLEAHLPPARRCMLEIGCGDGNFLGHLRAHGWRAEGTELDAASAERARRRHGVRVQAAQPEALAVPARGWPAVGAYHVLEHLYQPAAWMAAVRDLLAADGVLHLQVPNWASVTRVLTGAAWASLVFPQHVYFFTPRTLAGLLERSGLVAVSVTTWDPWHGPGALAGSLIEALRRRRGSQPVPSAGAGTGGAGAGKPRLARRLLEAAAVPLARLESLAGRGAVVDVIARRA